MDREELKEVLDELWVCQNLKTLCVSSTEVTPSLLCNIFQRVTQENQGERELLAKLAQRYVRMSSLPLLHRSLLQRVITLHENTQVVFYLDGSMKIVTNLKIARSLKTLLRAQGCNWNSPAYGLPRFFNRFFFVLSSLRCLFVRDVLLSLGWPRSIWRSRPARIHGTKGIVSDWVMTD